MQILEEKHPIFFGASTFDLKRFTQLQGRQSQRRIQGGGGQRGPPSKRIRKKDINQK